MRFLVHCYIIVFTKWNKVYMTLFWSLKCWLCGESNKMWIHHLIYFVLLSVLKYFFCCQCFHSHSLSYWNVFLSLWIYCHKLPQNKSIYIQTSFDTPTYLIPFFFRLPHHCLSNCALWNNAFFMGLISVMFIKNECVICHGMFIFMKKWC